MTRKQMCKIQLFHGSSTIHSKNLNELKKGAWFTTKLWHAFKLAERTSKRDGGNPFVICVELPESLIDRVIGRDIPNYRLSKDYKALRICEYYLNKINLT